MDLASGRVNDFIDERMICNILFCIELLIPEEEHSNENMQIHSLSLSFIFRF